MQINTSFQTLMSKFRLLGETFSNQCYNSGIPKVHCQNAFYTEIMKSIKVYYYGFIILLSVVGFAVLVILIFWASKFKRHWFGSKKPE